MDTGSIYDELPGRARIIVTRRRLMHRGRLEAFSDGVLAIVITIMVLDLKVPAGAGWDALRGIGPEFLTYVLSFVFLGIYWSNHHHMLHMTDRINGTILWANLHLLFWLSLTPVVTAWMGATHVAPVPTAIYGVVLLLAAVAYRILQSAIIAAQGPHSPLAAAIGTDRKGISSLLAYLAAIPLAFVNVWISVGLYVAIALVWLIPDRRIETRVTERTDGQPR